MLMAFCCSAAQNGAGVLSGLDARDPIAKQKGTGGLLQVSSYLTGLSSGSWLISSMLFHDFPEMHNLVLGNTDKGGILNGWFLDKGLFLPYYGINPFSQKNQFFWGCVAVLTIFLVRNIHLSLGIFSGALKTSVKLGSTHR
jgi:lysophospholipase